LAEGEEKMRMRDYINEAQAAVLVYEDGNIGMTTAELLAPRGVGNLLMLHRETNQLIFVGKLYNVVRRLEAAAHKFQNHPKSKRQQALTLLARISKRKKSSEEAEAIALITILAKQMQQFIIPAINAMEKAIEVAEIHDLRHGGLVVERRLERDYLALLERAELSREYLLEKLTWARRVLEESLPEWGY